MTPSTNTSVMPQLRNSSRMRKARAIQARRRPRASCSSTTTMPTRCTSGPRITVVSRVADSQGQPRVARICTHPGIEASRMFPCRRKVISGKALARQNRMSAVT